ncbi:hypothetical protein BO71DRAFT_141654 [Aspergillus ellipticus CBS 707.79]|uniref:Uncharacterized protein n=1 Tax=Aspergillus ellipticus CBS 707.79 TaxID=1448320 RepID=A0A319EB78_9EURO|nr:hypothetical protein BO71DRAFT_141654 [Aspergillus ellipticus CBS 707.79]
MPSTPPTPPPESLNWPQVPLEYPPIHIDNLDEPPVDWRLAGCLRRTMYRGEIGKKKDYETLLSYYSWGFTTDAYGGVDHNGVRSTTTARLIDALYKIFYNVAPRHQPKNRKELFDFTRDAGPRLLDPEKDIPGLLPISRYHPHPPNPNAQPVPGYIRPPNLPASLSDSYILQMYLPSSKGEELRWLAYDGPDLEIPELDDGGFDDSLQMIPGRGETALVSQDHAVVADPSNLGMSPQAIASLMAETYGPDDAGAIPDANPLVVGGGDRSAATIIAGERTQPVGAPDLVVEGVERLILKFAYTDLERHPTAASRDKALPFITATSEESLAQTIACAFPATSHVKFVDNFQVYEGHHAPRRQTFPYRGRGPVRSNSSSAADCAIIAGKLLDAGSTNIDRQEHGWLENLTDAERAFIEATDVDWDTLPGGVSTQVRDRFRQVIEPFAADSQEETVRALRSIWATSTKSFKQFQFSYSEYENPCVCTGSRATNSEITTSSATPYVITSDTRHGKDMQKLLSRFFSPHGRLACQLCQGSSATYKSRTFKSMPARLVVELDGMTSITNHTENVTIQYRNDRGSNETAIYRWLGGIYLHDNRLQLCWNDAERGEHDGKGMLRVYDSGQNCGIIVGGLPPAAMTDRVPELYWKNTQVPMIFYERVLNPSGEVIKKAMQTLYGMASERLYCRMPGDLLFQRNVGWTPSKVREGPDEYPWAPFLHPIGRQFKRTVSSLDLNIPLETFNESRDQADQAMPPTLCIASAASAAAAAAAASTALVRATSPLSIPEDMAMRTSEAPTAENPIDLTLDSPAANDFEQALGIDPTMEGFPTIDIPAINVEQAPGPEPTMENFFNLPNMSSLESNYIQDTDQYLGIVPAGFPPRTPEPMSAMENFFNLPTVGSPDNHTDQALGAETTMEDFSTIGGPEINFDQALGAEITMEDFLTTYNPDIPADTELNMEDFLTTDSLDINADQVPGIDGWATTGDIQDSYQYPGVSFGVPPTAEDVPINRGLEFNTSGYKGSMFDPPSAAGGEPSSFPLTVSVAEGEDAGSSMDDTSSQIFSDSEQQKQSDSETDDCEMVEHRDDDSAAPPPAKRAKKNPW